MYKIPTPIISYIPTTLMPTLVSVACIPNTKCNDCPKIIIVWIVTNSSLVNMDETDRNSKNFNVALSQSEEYCSSGLINNLELDDKREYINSNKIVASSDSNNNIDTDFTLKKKDLQL
ncbi:hypothetical protein PIROE2DRAFT_4595 [Piromyces sp. E2]|nr:hypothetical protein PIROE2DRAFT_4595 [Piromyces sp. E2]|eukprot:OUM67789.1 hypothetical protein PIROE2DRAFT_4595 [Piromyces sp. E2]